MRVHLVSFPTSTSDSLPTKEAGEPDAHATALGYDEHAHASNDLGGLVDRRWAKGEILGYRDRVGREAQVSEDRFGSVPQMYQYQSEQSR